MKINLLWLLLITYYVFVSGDLFAQNLSKNNGSEEVLEYILNAQENAMLLEGISVDDIVDKLNNPINLNTADEKELRELFILSPYQIQALLKYRAKVGVIESIYELQLIKGLDRITLQRLIPFVVIQKIDINKPVGKLWKYAKNELSLRYDLPFYREEGYKNKFQGSPFYLSIRYNYSIRDKVNIGFIAENDKGEPLFSLSNSTGFDYYSYYIQLKNIYFLKNIVIGNYRLHLGQGLLLGAMSYGGKWNSIQSFFRGESELKKHSSVDEFNYFRGYASICSFGNFELTSFLSSKRSDGSIKDNYISSFNTTGLHRTISEFDRKNKIIENVYGGRIGYNSTYFKIGINAIYYKFNYPLKQIEHGYKKYDIYGNYFQNISTDYTFYLNKFIVKGESATSKKGNSFLHKIYYSPNSNFDFLLIHRFYSEDYWGFYAKSFSSQAKVKNENGWFFIGQSRYINPLIITLYVDLYSSPWLKYRVSKASKTTDLGLSMEYIKNESNRILLRSQYKRFERDRSKVKGIIDKYDLYKFRVEYEWKSISHKVVLKTFCDYLVQLSDSKDSGYQLTERVSYLIEKFKCDIQYSYFCTSNFDTRVYIYEKGLLYNSYIPSFSGSGHRISVNLNYKPFSYIIFMVKYGLTNYTDRELIGSGINKIDGNRKSDLQLMARLKF